jgi:hypothetical protein
LKDWRIEKYLAMFSAAIILIGVGVTLTYYTVEHTRHVDGIIITESEHPYALLGGALIFVGLIWLAGAIVKAISEVLKEWFREK